MLLTVCLSDGTWWLSAVPEAVSSLRGKLEAIGLLPLTREDLFNIMINPFVEKHTLLTEYAKEEIGMSAKDIKDLVQDVAIKCLEIGSKVRASFLYFRLTHSSQGKTLRKLGEHYSLHAALADAAVMRYSLSLDDLPPVEDEKACATYEAALCRDFSNLKMIRANSSGSSNQTAPLAGESAEIIDAEMEGQVDDPPEVVIEETEETPATNDGPDLVRSHLLYTGILVLNRP